MDRLQKDDISRRIADLRVKVCGPRGKSAFAKMLGISPSTYDYYEGGRVPPADILVAMADIAEVDLRWLITGTVPVGPAIPNRHPVVLRVAKLLAARPNAAEALEAFLDILSQSMEFPDSVPSADEPDSPPPRSPAAAQLPPDADEERKSWVPILGRSAAGVPHFWSPAQAAGTTMLSELIAAQASGRVAAKRRARTGATENASPATVQIVTLREAADGKPVEFVADRSIISEWPDAFAVRIDGESMAPDIAHGDLVLLSPSAPAVSGRPAVVQLVNQVGVTCKIYRHQGNDVHLIPINDQFAPQVFPAEAVQWALRVLARVRPE
jgi:SOS-response transcriptional repressor LexA